MHVSENGLNLIKQFEGCSLTAYKDCVGVWTIGWGHTKNVYKGQVITQSEADNLLATDLADKYEKYVSKYDPTYNWNQNEFDALVSFAYNIGSIDQLTAKGTRTKSVIAQKMLQYNKAGGKVITGLTKRRTAEQKLFLTPISSIVNWNIGWNCDEYGWWYTHEDGSYITNGWECVDDKWYYVGDKGYIVTSQWILWDNIYYYLTSDGSMATSAYIQSASGETFYWVNENGAYEPEWDTATPDLTKYTVVQ